MTEDEELLQSDHEKLVMVKNNRFARKRFRADLERLRTYLESRDRGAAAEQFRKVAGRC